MAATKPRKKTKAVPKPAKKAGTKKAALKTTQTTQSVEAFLLGVPSKLRQEQARTAIKMLRRITGHAPKMWGPSIIGFGRYRYTYESGRQGEMCAAGFSPRKAAFAFYVSSEGVDDRLWLRLGTYKRGGVCVYVKHFEDIDLNVLEQILSAGYAHVKATHPG